MEMVLPKDRMNQTYRYRQLGHSNDIRLLKLHKCSGNDTKFSIVHVQLEDAPSYEAVSYVWGDPNSTQYIYLSDGTTLAVTTSLSRALPYLSAASRTGFLWIDQITIDQSNIKERSDQVSIMGRIYRRCLRCLIWIDSDRSIAAEDGTNPAWSSGAGAAMRRCLQSFPGNDIQQLPQTLQSEDVHQPLRISAPVMRPDPSVKDHLLWFLEHPWFSRTWVYQEFVLSPETVFLIGDFELPGEELEKVFRPGFPRSAAWFDSFRHTFNISIRSAVNFDEAPGLEFLVMACQARNRFGAPDGEKKSQEPFPLRTPGTFINYEPCLFVGMIHTMSASQTTDPRDHIYAFLGFAPFLLRHMRVDYSLAIEEVFATAVKAFLKESRSLEFLVYLPSEATISQSKLNLPSWIPDWTVKDKKGAITVHDNLFCASGRHFGLPHVKDCRHYDATAAFWQSLKWNELRVAGKIIDSVEFTLKKLSVYQTLPITSIDVNHCSGRLPWEISTLDAFFANLSELGCDKMEELSKEGLLRALFMDGAPWAALDALKSGENTYRTDVKIFGLPHHVKVQRLIAALLSSPDGVLDNLPLGASLHVLHELCRGQYGRRVILSAKRHFGLATDLVDRGDVVALLHGCRTPVIMRARPDGKFTILGQCYHDAAMYGELADTNDDNADTFILV